MDVALDTFLLVGTENGALWTGITETTSLIIVFSGVGGVGEGIGSGLVRRVVRLRSKYPTPSSAAVVGRDECWRANVSKGPFEYRPLLAGDDSREE